ncbi:MAG: hypothetical protein P8N43_12885 [Alphaproteobacteria bacterium]|jgi:hypothetical protein|nr:hypothetical protein [Alphaproteobacteria bacterium]
MRVFVFAMFFVFSSAFSLSAQESMSVRELSTRSMYAQDQIRLDALKALDDRGDAYSFAALSQ